ncbi:acyl-CoA N-acyltransferase, partial [Trametes versicolor FP-101664 SS1]|uniref:acyl-CoA N-acyltransferase n=1 Tax=Trametes versicolor (strain FP-101664) TaxID=717944 RepID=UPI0004621F88
EPVSLETDTENSQVQQEALLRAWVELYPHSVEAALANQSDMLEFGNNHCLFFAAVLWNHIAPVRLRPSPTVWPLLNGEPLQSLAPSVTFADDGAVNSTPQASQPVFRLRVPGAHMSCHDLQTATENEAGSVVETMRVWDTVGVVYITSSLLPSQVHIGVGILPAFRGNGLGRRACEIALGWAVDTLQMHRVQARILPSPHQHRSRSLFAALGLVHEGVHRRAVLSPSGEWADVAHMGLLDTDWHIRSRLVAQPTSLWDELLGRHQREVEDMLRFEERQRSVRRTSSMETIR